MRLLVAILAILVTAPAWAQSPPAPNPSPTPAPTPAPSNGQPSPPDTWVARTTADLVLLEKLRGQPSQVSVRTGQSVSFGTLTIAVRNCVTRPPDLPQNSAAFLEITDSRGTVPVFRGWVLSNTPAVSQLEHPVYDLRLAACH